MQYLYFIRHGETAYNRSGRVQGRTDIPLSEQGLIQAQLARDFFHKQGIRFDLVISFDAKDRRAVFSEAVADVRKAFPDYQLQVAMDTDFTEQ